MIATSLSSVIDALLMTLYATLPTDPNTKNDNDDNALHVACRNSSDEDISELVKLLIER